jgi:hypothetical protein
MHSDQFVEAIRRVAGGGTAMDPEVIARLLARNTDNDVVSALIPCEREVRGLMAEGWSNATIGQQLAISGYVVAKHWPPTSDGWSSDRPTTTIAASWRSWRTSEPDALGFTQAATEVGQRPRDGRPGS